MTSNPVVEPLKPRNYADPPVSAVKLRSSRVLSRQFESALVETAPYATPDPKKALLTFFADADSSWKPEVGGDRSECRLLEGTTHTYKAAYGSMQKHQSAFKGSKTGSMADSEKVTELQYAIRSTGLQLTDLRVEREREEARRSSLAETLAKMQATSNSESTLNANLNRELAKLTTDKTKLESSIKYSNDRIEKLKALFAKFDSGKIDQRETISELETDLRQEKLQRHQLEMELLATKQSIQREKQTLLLLRQQYDSVDLAKKAEQDEIRDEYRASQQEEQNWKEELTARWRALDDVLGKAEVLPTIIAKERAAIRRGKSALASSSVASTQSCLVVVWMVFFCLGVILQFTPSPPSGIS